MREDQFDSLDAYNDYLEEIETIGILIKKLDIGFE